MTGQNAGKIILNIKDTVITACCFAYNFLKDVLKWTMAGEDADHRSQYCKDYNKFQPDGCFV